MSKARTMARKMLKAGYSRNQVQESLINLHGMTSTEATVLILCIAGF
jgi:hypothetical protein